VKVVESPDRLPRDAAQQHAVLITAAILRLPPLADQEAVLHTAS
jgi:hypothetical protein